MGSDLSGLMPAHAIGENRYAKLLVEADMILVIITAPSCICVSSNFESGLRLGHQFFLSSVI
jgi:hypothetical protein